MRALARQPEQEVIMVPQMLTPDRLRELLSYNPETGLFHWRVAKGNRAAGALAGSRVKEGYIAIKLDGVLHYAHRLAWFYVYGAWPDDQIDHANTDRIDNRIRNLRDVTNAQNSHNKGGESNVNNTSTGLRGVSPAKNGRYRARIMRYGVWHSLGRYRTAQEAYDAYRAAAAKLTH